MLRPSMMDSVYDMMRNGGGGQTDSIQQFQEALCSNRKEITKEGCSSAKLLLLLLPPSWYYFFVALKKCQ